MEPQKELRKSIARFGGLRSAAPTLIWLDLSSPRRHALRFLGLRVGTVIDRTHPKTIHPLRSGSLHNQMLLSCDYYVTSRFLLGKGQGDQSRWTSLRRLISLISACWLTHEVDPTGASSLYEQASVASMRPAVRVGRGFPPTVLPTRPVPLALSFQFLLIVNSIKQH